MYYDTIIETNLLLFAVMFGEKKDAFVSCRSNLFFDLCSNLFF